MRWNKDYGVRPARGEPRGALVLHHGRGTSAEDLAPLIDARQPGLAGTLTAELDTLDQALLATRAPQANGAWPATRQAGTARGSSAGSSP